MKPVDFEWAAAVDAADARRRLAQAGDGAKLIAGGQSLGPMLNLRLSRPSLLVSLGKVAALVGVTDYGDAIAYGAAVTHARIEDGEVADATPGWLARIAGGIAYRAVRNRGTIGGSLAHADPAADWVVTLSALGAEVLIDGGATRREALPAFFVGAFATRLRENEVLSGVVVPKRGARARFGYWKFVRKPGEFAHASAAVLIDEAREGVRMAVGALEAPPVLLDEPARLLSHPEAIIEALSARLPGRSRETLALHATAVRRAIAACVA